MTAPAPIQSPIGIYVHIPYCTRICPYCDFNVYARRDSQFPAYVDAVLREIELAAGDAGDRAVATVFIGGGTPSLVAAEDIRRIVERIEQCFTLDPAAEISMEANPEGLEPDHLRRLREAGINRLSIGVQTVQAHGLKVLGRAHKPDTPARGIAAARAAGFDNLSLDFIFGWPEQARKDWERDLDFIEEAAPEHVSMYSLIIEPGTPYQTAVDRGILAPVDDDRVSEMYEYGLERMRRAGWDHYEISNWASQSGTRSRHNMIYWRNAEYIALGAGAHGYLGGVRYSNIRLPERYMDAIAAGTLPVAERESINEATAMAETMMLGLRLVVDGVSAAAFRARHGYAIDAVYGEQIEHLRSIGMLEWNEDSLRLTRHGLLIANEVMERFLDPVVPELSH